jgi:hypothetical protein
VSAESAGVALRTVAVPAEHGGWSLTLEPVVMGLIAAPGAAGAALGLAALVAFAARTPLRIVLVDRRRHRRLPRTGAAARVLAAELVLLVGLVVVAVVTAAAPFWTPPVLAAPLVAGGLWFDARSRSRRLAPELLATVGIGSVAASIALAGGAAAADAYGLWIVAAARAIAAIPFVRFQLRRRSSRRAGDTAQLIAVAIGAGGFAAGLVTAAGVIAIVVLAVAHLFSSRRPPPPTPVLGAQQVVLGLSVAVAAGLGARAP